MQNTDSGEELDDAYQALRKVETDPNFRAVLAEIEHLPPLELLNAAFTQLTWQALADRQIPIAPKIGVTVRASRDSVGPTTGTADVAVAGQNTAVRPKLWVELLLWVPFTDPNDPRLHSTRFLIRPPLDTIPYQSL